MPAGIFSPDEKVCLRCGEAFRRGKTKRRVWRTRKYCSQTCANRDRGTDDAKPCEQCHHVIRRKALDGVSISAWRRRRFCTVACKAEWTRAHPGEAAPRYHLDRPAETRREWPAEARFDAPGMCVPDGPGNFVRFSPSVGRFI